MNDARYKEIRRALTLLKDVQRILETALTEEQDDLDSMPDDLRNDETGQRAEDTVDALERAATYCDDVISACEDALQMHRARITAPTPMRTVKASSTVTAEQPLSRVMRRSDRPSDGSASCSTNGLAKSKGKVSNLVIGPPSGQKRFIQMGVLCPAARSD